MTTAVVHSNDGSKLFSENTTLLHPLINVTHSVTTKVDMNDPDYLSTLPWFCLCAAELPENENESECSCEGKMLLKIPQKMPQITRLEITNAKFKVLREAGLRKYSPNLRDM